jgi:RNA methyltransferase, TrmH family
VPGAETALIGRFGAARTDPRLVVLEGLHALKHALRFGARIEIACSPEPAAVLGLADGLAPDLAEQLAALVQQVPPATFAALAPVPPPTGVIALAARPEVDPRSILGMLGAPVVLLENPSHLGNLGAVVRTAAAAAAGAVLVAGSCDPWHPAALRGSAGLHFALPVARLDTLPDGPRPLLAIDPRGMPLTPDLLADGSILAFGSERRGLSEAILARAERRIAIPMRDGVSSLNLASAVAIALYAWRLARPSPPPVAPTSA